MVTELVDAGSKTYPVEATTVEKPVLSVLPCTDKVWVRAPQLAGSRSTTWSMLVTPPRSTCTHCGKALLVLSQYVDWLPSSTLAAVYGPFELLAEVGLPAARLGPPAATADGPGPAVRSRPAVTTTAAGHA